MAAIHDQTALLPATSVLVGLAVHIITRPGVTRHLALVNSTHAKTPAFLLASRILMTANTLQLFVPPGAPF